MDRKRTLGADLTIPLRPRVSPHEPSIELALSKGEDQPTGFCPGCRTLSILCRPDRAAIASYLQGTSLPSHASLVAEREMICPLCSIQYDPTSRKAAVMLGHIYYLIGTPDSVPQEEINRQFWGVIERSSRRFRQSAREGLRDRLFFEERCKDMRLPAETMSAAEIEEVDRHLMELVGKYAWKRFSPTTKEAMFGTYGMTKLLERGRNPKPEWLGNERYLLSPNGIEHYRDLVAKPLAKCEVQEPEYIQGNDSTNPA
jgi:hypothetical protein